MVAPPAGMGLLANSQRMGVAGTRVAPSEEPAVVGPVAVGPAVVGPVAPEPAGPEHAFL